MNNWVKTQDAFTNILQTIGPMMSSLAQSGLVSPNQNQMTQNHCLNYLIKLIMKI